MARGTTRNDAGRSRVGESHVFHARQISPFHGPFHFVQNLHGLILPQARQANSTGQLRRSLRSRGHSSPPLPVKDLGEAGTAHVRAMLSQEPGTATNTQSEECKRSEVSRFNVMPPVQGVSARRLQGNGLFLRKLAGHRRQHVSLFFTNRLCGGVSAAGTVNADFMAPHPSQPWVLHGRPVCSARGAPI